MKEHQIESLVEAISYGYKDEIEEISRKYNFSHKKNNLNFPKIKRNDNLKKWLDNQDPENFVFISKQSFLFVEKFEGNLYAVMTEDYKNKLVRDFRVNNKLNYITAMIVLKNSTEEIDVEKDVLLFDTTPYLVDQYEEETYEEASEKARKILENYDQIIKKVCIITRENTNEDNPRIMMHELSKNFETITTEDWSKYLPNTFNNNFEHDKKEKQQKEIKENRVTKHARLRKKDEKTE